MRTAILSAAIILTLAAPSVAADAQHGAALARQWCVGCHAVEAQAEVSDLTPSFQSVARRRAGQPGALKMYLVQPHAPMPPFSLSNREIDDLVAYILSLPTSKE